VAFRRKIRRINKSDRLERITSDQQRNVKTIEQEHIKNTTLFADVSPHPAGQYRQSKSEERIRERKGEVVMHNSYVCCPRCEGAFLLILYQQ
jgi:hypothetical protein